MKKITLNLFLLLFCSSQLMAENAWKPALDDLMDSVKNDQKDYLEYREKAKEAGVPETKLLEVQIHYLLNQGDVHGLIQMVDDLERVKNQLEFGQGETFMSLSQLNGYLHTLRAVDAFQKEEVDRYEKEVKEAFWLSPNFVMMFGLDKQIQAMQEENARKELLKSMVVPMDIQVQLMDASMVSLKDLLGDKKALLIDFWASWCGPCMRLMPELKKKAESLPAKGVVVVAINTEEDALETAKKIKEEKGMDMPWAVETGSTRLNWMLMINTIPQMVLLNPEGKILFQGHPMDEGLHEALSKLGIE